MDNNLNLSLLDTIYGILYIILWFVIFEISSIIIILYKHNHKMRSLHKTINSTVFFFDYVFLFLNIYFIIKNGGFALLIETIKNNNNIQASNLIVLFAQLTNSGLLLLQYSLLISIRCGSNQ